MSTGQEHSATASSGVPVFDLLDVAAVWKSDQLGPCVGDDGETADLNISDMRLKTDVSEIGITVFGLPLYRFSYKGQEGVYTGVMAQDVLNVLPGAVSLGADGFYRVSYGMLGISMERLA